MARLFRKPHRVQWVFRLYFSLLFLITAVLSFSHLKQSQKSLLNYALLYAQKNNEVLQASFPSSTARSSPWAVRCCFRSDFPKRSPAVCPR